MKLIRSLLLLNLLLIVSAGAAFAQTAGSIGGTVTDANGAVVPGATVTVLAADGKKKEYLTNAKGEYTVTGLAAGKYTVKAIAKSFDLYQNEAVDIAAGQKAELIIVLIPASITENVDVKVDNMVSNDPTENKDATVLKDKDLDALPDDPDEMQAALQALAGVSAGPNGGQIYIDGFTGGQLPPKESIREIRINQNPFSAEFDRVGNGRIEILTKPGTDKWRGSANASFNDESLNSRNPFATNRAPTQARNFGGNFSGPIVKKNSSFFVDVNNRDNDNNAIINATILDPNFNIVGFRRDVRQPTKRFSIAPRVDFAINPKNTLVARYSFTHSSSSNLGISETSLLSRAYVSSSHEHEIRLTESMIINPRTVNETRFEFSKSNRDQLGDNSIPTVSVSSAFTSGGASIGHSFNDNTTWDINNMTITSFSKAAHSVKFGGRIRHVNINDQSQQNYAGTFGFSGIPQVTSPAGCFPINPPANPASCVLVTPAVTSIDQYRLKLTTGAAADNPTSFGITTGSPLATVSQYEASAFFTDDWRVNPALLLSFGLRYENQTNISSKMNFAPRAGFAWSPGAGGAKQPKTVIRGGGGIFFDRFGENNTLSALRSSTQLSLTVNALDSDPARKAASLALLAQPVFTLNGVTNVPTAAQILAVLPQSNTLRIIDPNYTSPYQILGQIGVDRTISSKLTASVRYQWSRGVHLNRTRNINAPVCTFGVTTVCLARPQATLGNILEYESNGIQKESRLNFNLQARLSTKVTLFASYSLGSLKGNADGTPAYAYNLTDEFGRTNGDTRNTFSLFGNFTLPWAVSLSPIVTANSGRPFNIVNGIDTNGDGFASERPTFAQLQTGCARLNITASFCNIGSNSPTAIIPKNYAEGPGSFFVSLRISKTFGFGKSPQSRVAGNNGGGGGGGGGNRGGGGGAGPAMMGGGDRGGMMGGRGGFGGGDVRHPYNLNFGIFVTNLFNNVNLATPNGNLASSRFGQSTSTSGGFGGFGGGFGGGGSAGPNRRVELSMRFSF